MGRLPSTAWSCRYEGVPNHVEEEGEEQKDDEGKGKETKRDDSVVDALERVRRDVGALCR